MTIRIAEFFLFNDFRVVFGHDWREDGVMRAIAKFAEIAASRRGFTEDGSVAERMVNLVPTNNAGLSRLAIDAQNTAHGVLKVAALSEYIQQSELGEFYTGWQSDRWSELWVLRYALTQILNPGIRICLGGRMSGYSGYYPGIVEEAYFALTKDKPLYLIGGFGGATAAVINALSATAAENAERFPPALLLEEASNDIECLRAAVADQVELPQDHLGQALAEFNIEQLAHRNGLSIEQNFKLFNSTDIELALDLIWAGVRELGI
jgi:hypothetical protein